MYRTLGAVFRACTPIAAGVLATIAAMVAIASLTCSAAAQAQEVPASPPDAEALLLEADRIRFPRESFETRLSVINYKGDNAGIPRVYRVMSRGNDHTVVLTEAPAAERGQALLMRERDLWIFMPSVSQPVRLSLSQRLTGQVANGDLARANFAGDYSAELAGTEVVDDTECYVLELDARGRDVTYARVRYWVAVDDNRPVKAEFYAVSGRLLKTARYDRFRELEGRQRPTRLIIEDAIKGGEYSVLEYESMALREFPDRLFTQQYLRRL